MKCGSLFSGIGGLDMAVCEFFDADLAWVSEIEPGPVKVLERHFPVPNIGDVTKVDWSEVEPVDIICGGYPCQPFSKAGKRRGAADPRHLWPHFKDALRVLRPRYAVLENVAGHLRLGFDSVLADLAELGFDAEWTTVRASDVGAPHRRERLFCLGTANPDFVRHLDREPRKQPTEPGHTPLIDIGGGGGEVTSDSERERRGEQGDTSAEGHAQEAGVARISDWGDYEPAIRGWELVMGRSAPSPVDDKDRLAPEFVEWMMGYPSGHTAGLTRAQRLKALGNAVVPNQAYYALNRLAS